MTDRQRPTRASRWMRRAAMVVTPVLIAVGVALPATPAAAVNYVPCGNPDAVNGIVNAIDSGNRYLGGTVTVHLTPGCVYELASPAWDFDDYGNKIYEDSAFYELDDTLGYDVKLIVEGHGATIRRANNGSLMRLFDIGSRGDVVLRDLTIADSYGPHGNLPGNYGGEAPNGGAILNEGILALENVTFTGNRPGNGENGTNTAAIDGFSGGSGGSGGAIANRGTLTISGSTFRNNRTGDGGAGGNASFNGGQGGQSGEGGAIWNSGTLTITTSTFDGNSTGNAGSGGGGAYGSPGSYRGNGGAIASSSGSVTITRSLFLGNSTGGFAGEGGAVAMRNGSGLSVGSSTFVNNTANRAGAIYMSGGAASVRGSTFTGNNANGTGSRITGDVAAMDYGATMSFANTLMYGNDPGQVDCNVQYVGNAVTYSSLGGVMSDENSGCGTNSVVADPKLEALGAWGGPTQTRALKADSPALGAGTAAYCGGVDQRGVPRPASGCDVGAVERIAALTPGVINGPAIVSQNVAKTYSTTTTLDGAQLEYRWSVSGVPATLSSTGAASPQITFTGFGVATVNLNMRVVGASDAESVNVPGLTVKVPPAGNTPPQLAWTGAAVTAANEGDTKRFTFSVVEPEDDDWAFSPGFPNCGTGGNLITPVTQSAGGGYFDCVFPNGPATSSVKLQVEDLWSSATSITTSVAVAEVNPTVTVTVSGSATPNEGSTGSFGYTIYDPGTDIFTPVTSCSGAGASKVAGSDQYASGLHNSSGLFQCRFGNGPSTATATVTAMAGTGSASVSVQNVAPSINVSGPSPTPENGSTATSYRYELNAVDPGDKASLTVVPGSPSCGVTGVVVGFDASAVVCRFAGGPGSAHVTATLRDPDGATSSGGGLTVSISNVAPTVTIAQPSGPVAEGGTVFFALTVTDPGLDTLTVTPPVGCTTNFLDTAIPGKLTAQIGCTYADGPATVSRTVQVSDGTSTVSAVIANQQVTNVLPSITAGFTTWDSYAGGTVTLRVGTDVTDPGTETIDSILVNWGDGTSTSYDWPLATADLTHVYNSDAEFHATVDIIDDDGTHENRGGDPNIYVRNSPPTLYLTVPAPLYEGTPTTIEFTVGNLGTGEGFTIANVSCGHTDSYVYFGATNQVIGETGGSFDCTWPQGKRNQPIHLEVRDSGGFPAQADAYVWVENIDPLVQWTTGPTVVAESLTAVHTFGFHASDPGSFSVHPLTYPITGGLNFMFGCGDGGVVTSYPGGPGTYPNVYFDQGTGDGYIECRFERGTTTAEVWITMTDDIGWTSIYRDVAVLNDKPTVELTGPSGPVVEGDPVVFSYVTGDPVGELVSPTDIDCGTGDEPTSQEVGTFTCVYPDGLADYSASITVSDGVDTDTDSAGVHVLDVAPTSIALTGAAFYEPNQAYELILGATNDPGDDTVGTWIIHWGDGSTSIETSATPSPTHVYSGHDPHTVTVDVIDEDGTYLAIGTKGLLEFDHVPPVLTLPGDTTMEANVSEALLWDWPRSAIDDRDGDITASISCTGIQYYDQINWFWVGTTANYHCSVSDAAGNTSSGDFSVTAVDTTGPKFNPVGFDYINATSPDGAAVSWDTNAYDVVDWPRARPGTCDHTSGALYAIGTYTVYCTASDSRGNPGEYTFTFEVGDFAGPAISASAFVDIEATGPDGAIATYPLPTAWDSLDGALPVSCSPASGSLFPLSYTTVTCSATDSTAHTSTSTFMVRIHDYTPPVVAPMPDILVGPTSPDGAVVSFETPTATDIVDQDLVVECTPGSGSTFPLGVTQVTCITRDDWLWYGWSQFNVTVQDEGAPTVTSPADVVLEATSADGEVVTYLGGTAFDIVDGTLPITCDHASGSLFPFGVTTVTCTATDSEDHVGTATFTVSIVDRVNPEIVVPADFTVEATGPGGAPATFAVTATDAIDGSLPVTCTPASGSVFIIGPNSVSCSAADESGNPDSASFVVTVEDTTAPVIYAPDITLPADSIDGTYVFYPATATDLVNGGVALVCDVPSGTQYGPERTTTVTCTATDVSGNQSSDSFIVRIHGAVMTEAMAAEDTEVEVSLDMFAPGDYVVIDEGGPTEEVRLISELGSIIFAAPVAHAHAAGTSVSIIAPPPQDTTAPDIAFSQPGNVVRGSALTVPVTCTDAGVGVEACRVPALSTSSLGEHIVLVRAWDWNGNLRTAELRYTVVPAASGLGSTGSETVSPTAAIAALLLLAGLCLLGYRRWSRRQAW